MKTSELKIYIENGGLDASFASLYGEEKVAVARDRYTRAADEFIRRFGDKEANFFSVSGRTELSGNHTDHNFGKVIAASVDLDVIAVASAREDGIITVKSEGVGEDTVSLDGYTVPDEALFGTSASIIAGVAAGFL